MGQIGNSKNEFIDPKYFLYIYLKSYIEKHVTESFHSQLVCGHKNKFRATFIMISFLGTKLKLTISRLYLHRKNLRWAKSTPKMSRNHHFFAKKTYGSA